MSQWQATKIFGELVRCGDIQAAIRNLTDDEVRGLSRHLNTDPQYSDRGVPGMILGLLELEAADRFLKGGAA